MNSHVLAWLVLALPLAAVLGGMLVLLVRWARLRRRTAADPEALGLALALLLDQKLKGRNLVRSVVFAPFVISGAAIGVAFQFVFDPSFGLIQDLLAKIGVASPDFYQKPGWALFMVTATYIWKNLGYSFVIYLAALQARRGDLDEAAEIDGASKWTHFRKVLLPQLRPTTFFLSITVLLSSVQVFDIIYAMT